MTAKRIFSEKEIDEMVRLYTLGDSHGMPVRSKAIAGLFRCSYPLVIRALRARGIILRPGAWWNRKENRTEKQRVPHLRRSPMPGIPDYANVCSCGCGTIIPWMIYQHGHWQPRRFVQGHWSKTEEARKASSVVSRRIWNDPEKRADMRRRISAGQMGRPGTHKGPGSMHRANERFRELMKDPVEKARIFAYTKTEAFRRKLSEANRGKPSPKAFVDTTPELVLEQNLRTKGLVFQKHKTIKLSDEVRCNVDFVLEPNILVFVDGCFWHGCPDYLRPSGPIVAASLARDKVVNAALASRADLKVFRVWEHELVSWGSRISHASAVSNPEAVVARISAFATPPEVK